MVFRKILHNLDGAIAHVADADSGRGRLGSDKATKILKLRAQAAAGSIVKQDEQLKRGSISLQGNPVGRLDPISTLINHHIFFLDGGYIGSMTSFHSHNH